MKPGAYNPTFVQGDDWSFELAVRDATGAAIDMAGWTFLAQARTDPRAQLAWTFTVDTTQAASGILTLTVAKAVTADVEPGIYVWDLQWTDGAGDVRTILAGRATVLAEVSR